MTEEIKIFQVPAIPVKASSMSRWWRLVFDLQENISTDKIAIVLQWLNKLGWLSFSAHTIEADDIKDLPEIRPEDVKSPAQRLAAVMFRLWQQNPEGHETSESYYRAKMEKLINFYKEGLV